MIISNERSRTVTLEAPTGAMASVAAEPSLTPEELAARQKDAFEKRRLATEAYLAKVRAEQPKQEGPTDATPPSVDQAKIPVVPAPSASQCEK